MGWTFEAEVWRHDGSSAAWHFLTLPFGVADEIDEQAVGAERGFGSVRVEVTIGSTTWTTSVFPDKARQSYVLPVKKAVRTAEGLDDGTPVTVELRLIEPS